MSATPTVHYFAVTPGRIVERHHMRYGDRPLTAAEARGNAMDVAEEAAGYAKVPIDWTIVDAPDGDGWIVTSSQFGRVIHKRSVKYLGIVDPRKREPQPKYVEHSRHASEADAYKVIGDLKAAGRYAHLSFDSYSKTPCRVMVQEPEPVAV